MFAICIYVPCKLWFVSHYSLSIEFKLPLSIIKQSFQQSSVCASNQCGTALLSQRLCKNMLHSSTRFYGSSCFRWELSCGVVPMPLTISDSIAWQTSELVPQEICRETGLTPTVLGKFDGNNCANEEDFVFVDPIFCNHHLSLSIIQSGSCLKTRRRTLFLFSSESLLIRLSNVVVDIYVCEITECVLRDGLPFLQAPAYRWTQFIGNFKTYRPGWGFPPT